MYRLKSVPVILGLVSVVVLTTGIAVYLYFRTHPKVPAASPITVQDLYHQKKYNSALALANQQIKDDPENASLYCLMGNISRDMGSTQAAIDDYIKALTKNPSYEPARINLIQLEMDNGRKDDARKALQEGLAITPTDPSLLRLQKALQ